MQKLLAAVVTALVATVASADEIPGLVKQLKGGDVEARRSAAKALGEAGEAARNGVPALTEALRDNDMYVRRFAARSLGDIGPAAKAAIPALSTLVKNGQDKKEVLDAATEALGKIGTGAASISALAATLLDKSRDPEQRRKAAEALGLLGAGAKPAIPALVEVLKPAKGNPPAGSGDLRAEVATALGAIASPEDKPAVDTLTTVSKDKMLARDRTLMKAVNDALKKIQAKKS
jgi:HEAT repeat protein